MTTTSPQADPMPGEDRGEVLLRYQAVRRRTVALTDGLSAEDQQVQSMPDASPTKWHLAHTSWFFEVFLLAGRPGHAPFDARFGALFNSYYEALGERHPRPERGLLSRPALGEVLAYRAHVDRAMARLIAETAAEDWPGVSPLLALGLNHEQQHQELLLMDIKHLFSVHPLAPAYAGAGPRPVGATRGADWRSFPGGLVRIGADDGAFAFDNERPRHAVWLEPFRLADRLVTAGDWLAFIEDGGYRRAELWLSDGWAECQARDWSAPLYWRRGACGEWRLFTLHGEQALSRDAPVCHVSFYEADAFARWSGRRLPTEAEWEVAAATGGGAEPAGSLHPEAQGAEPGLREMRGVLWQWTASPYVAYPRYRPAPGAIGEYNGKFMANQMVLRGGACVTPRGHARITYRNFYPPAARWAFSGVRLADDG